MARKAPSKGSAALTHIDARGEARMVDVSEKPATERIAVAEGRVVMSKATLELIVSGNAKKGDVLGTARIAGIMAAKRTSELIPLCHPLALSKVTLDITPDKKLPGCIVRATVKVTGPTGVEMEALTAVSVACLTIYDMIKAVERGVRIEGIHLVEKKGGKSGHYRAERLNSGWPSRLCERDDAECAPAMRCCSSSDLSQARNAMSISSILARRPALCRRFATPAMAQEVIYEPGYCAFYYPNANCQNKGPGNPYTRSAYAPPRRPGVACRSAARP